MMMRMEEYRALQRERGVTIIYSVATQGLQVAEVKGKNKHQHLFEALLSSKLTSSHDCAPWPLQLEADHTFFSSRLQLSVA